MKFFIDTTPLADGWQVEIKSDEKPDFHVAPRELKRLGEKKKGFPVPVKPQGEAASWAGQKHARLCEPDNDDPALIEQLYEDIIFKGDPGPDGVEIFGRYLSALLIGEHWQAMLTTAANNPIELDVHFEANDVEMHRLPWEMMYGTDRPLAADQTRDISIARIVTSKVSEVEPLKLPLKLLFVIGRQLDDALRPGAEYLSMLRRMKVQLKTHVQSVDMNVRLLTETTTDELQAAITTFQPDVVHFTCHGDVTENGGRLLLTKRETVDVTSRKTQEPDYCDAERLLNLLRHEKSHKLPQIVVLNACHTADASGDEDIKGAYRSLAANLVAEGVPVAIGMSGEVADGVCRIFTRKFYEALLTANPITRASARGRRAAMIHFTDSYKTSVEWARPTLFIAKGFSSTITLDTKSNEGAMAEIPSKYIKDSRILCDRFKYLQAYQDFRTEAVTNSVRKLLAFMVDEALVSMHQFGKTRLLEEIAAHAVMDNFIPCVILPSTGGIFEPPTTLLSLALRLAESMDETRDYFSIAKRATSHALDLAFMICYPNPPDVSTPVKLGFEKGRVKKALKELGERDKTAEEASAVRAAMLEDFRQLQIDVEKKTGEKRTPLVLLDDLHRYEVSAPRLLYEIVDGHGLGDQTLSIPLVFTYSTFNSKGEALPTIKDFVSKTAKYVFGNIPLKRISDEHEVLLAYCQYMLSRDPPLAVNPHFDSKFTKHLLNSMHKIINGVPSLFEHNDVKLLLEYNRGLDVLLDADDERIFKSLN